MNNETCPVHGVPFKWVPPGTSKKTGQPYQGFWSCSYMGCRNKPQGDTPAPSAAFATATTVAPVAAPSAPTRVPVTDWDEIGKQKNRSNIIAAALTSGKAIDYVELDKAEKWVLFGTQKPKTPDLWAPTNAVPEVNVDDIPF